MPRSIHSSNTGKLPAVDNHAAGSPTSTMAQHQQIHPIFDDIARGDLGAVQQRVLADGAVLEERYLLGLTPLIYAAIKKKPAIALWLIQHRGQHDINTESICRWTALQFASANGLLKVVQALVAAGANLEVFNSLSATPLTNASAHGHVNTVRYLLQLATFQARINHIDREQGTALSYACRNGHLLVAQLLLDAGADLTVPPSGEFAPLCLASRYGYQPIVQLLLDVGADPTIPAGEHSPLNQAISHNHHAIAALLRHVIGEAKRVRECVTVVGKRGGLGEDLCSEISKFLLPAWATQGQDA